MCSPEAIHVHLAAHLPYGDLRTSAHIWFQLQNPNQGKCYGASLWERGDGWMYVCVWGGGGFGEGTREVGGLLRSGLCLSEVFLCVWRDLNTVIYFTSPKQIRQAISTQAEN